MIHYHGTPVGGSRVDAARFLRGRHALVPFDSPQDLPIVQEVCQSFISDNSAFTKWRRGEMQTPQEVAAWASAYVEWCEGSCKHPGFDGALIPDVIDGDEATNDALLREWPRHIEGIPVWHLHESIERLARLASEWRTVALGSSGRWSSPGTKGWWARMNDAMGAVCDAQGRPRCRLHGLRMLDPQIFTRLPLASADSTNAAVNGGSLSRFGMYVPPTASQRAEVIASRIEAHTSAPVWCPTAQDDIFTLRAG